MIPEGEEDLEEKSEEGRKFKRMLTSTKWPSQN
jgi:hypothetical protein